MNSSQALTDCGVRALVLGILRENLTNQLDRYIAAHRAEVVAAFETWWDKYRVTLGELEASRDAARTKLEGFLVELGYRA